jgi:hypothetical protein
LGALIGGVAFTTTTFGEAAAAGRGTPASACTVRVGKVHNIPANATQDVPTSSQNGSGFLGVMLVASGRLSIF